MLFSLVLTIINEVAYGGLNVNLPYGPSP